MQKKIALPSYRSHTTPCYYGVASKNHFYQLLGFLALSASYQSAVSESMTVNPLPLIAHYKYSLTTLPVPF